MDLAEYAPKKEIVKKRTKLQLKYKKEPSTNVIKSH